MEENSVDSIVTDPPYGWRFMGKAWDGADIEAKIKKDKEYRERVAKEKGEWRIAQDGRRRRRAKGLIAGPAAYGGEWDTTLTGNQSFQKWTEEWAREALRILKPGAHALIFCGPRTYHRMATGVEDAGFEVRDQLQWLFGSGFPKSLNLKSVREGWGTALKPANEPILLARKPLSEKTVAKNILKWGTGGLNVDGCRIDGAIPVVPQPKLPGGDILGRGKDYEGRNGELSRAQGRFPANLLLDEEAAKMLDEQTGHLHGAGFKRAGSSAPRPKSHTPSSYTIHTNTGDMHRIGDSGGASRFFYVAKASKRERNAGLDSPEITTDDGRNKPIDNPYLRGETKRMNHHPTVKPLTLMRYLVRLVTPPNGIVLDPFMGSGTTGVAAKEEGFEFIGLEREAEYMKIAEARCNA